ncbi:MAG: acetyl-CoA carboxylase biotin carboxylase subunit [Candidatus Eisenbacteria bacterium]|nr:acetyl-CoA carboxylase biotin carboxylase subunit [Candidatus Eisenbacteria bacterium]
MFAKVLVANRGEIALRVMRACKELGIPTVAIHSEADTDGLHVKFADEAVCVGPAHGGLSYLDARAIISACEVTGADALHPGYGFLAENAEFADMCEAHNVTFIGPTGNMMRRLGDKAQARSIMADSGVPVIPGSEGVVADTDEAEQIADSLGYPVMIKAAAGGGGKGMRIAADPDELRSNFRLAASEAGAAFGNDAVYIEKVMHSPRHVELQVLGDKYGKVVHLGERDCSIQRRHQKLIEESPSPAVNISLRRRMGEAAVRGTTGAGYVSAGTVEFLVDAAGDFYFMEMNTRIQVEHPVTELVTGVDLVKEQIRIAAGQRIELEQDKLGLRGHAIECRINAEDPDRDFAPSPGTVTEFYVPGGPGIRVDTHVYSGYVIPPYYDSMIAKLLAYGNTREEAIARMRRALEEFVIEGVATTIPFHSAMMRDPDFVSGHFDTGTLGRKKKASLERVGAAY